MSVRNIIRVVSTCLLLLPFTFVGSSDAEVVTPEQKTGVVLFLGDSLTAGYGIAPENSYPALLRSKIESIRKDLKIVNAGVSGDTTAGGLRRLNWLLKQNVEVLVLALGGNDGLRGTPLAETKKNLLTIIEKTRERFPDSKIILAGMMIPPSMGVVYAKEFQEIFPAVSKEANVALVPFLLDGVAAEPALNLADGIHPNEEGYKLVAENVWKVLQPSLQTENASN